MGKKTKTQSYIDSWKKRGYPIDIPDEVPIELERRCLAPSYRAICISIMKNDFQFQYLGFEKEKSKQYSEIKRLEIEQRKGFKQLRLF
tara:strand:+ start:1205 stop:1468 length:264 start_codon:yes stop_codon:yes gene_type:complete